MFNAWLVHLNQNSLKSIIGSYKITIYIYTYKKIRLLFSL